MALTDHLAPLRAHKGQRLTQGLDDATIERLAKGHPDLVAAIEAAAAEHARLQDEFARLAMTKPVLSPQSWRSASTVTP